MNNPEPSAEVFPAIRKFFASIRLTIVILLSLAASSVIGTLVPQNENPAAAIQRYGDFLYRLMDWLNVFDMYHSWWFQLLLLLLTVNIVVCSLERLQVVAKTVFAKDPKFRLARFEKLEGRISFVLPRRAEDLRDIFSSLLAKAYGRTRVDAAGGGYHLFGEKGRYTRLGVYAVHLSIVLLVLGGLIGSLLGFEGYVNIPEGESVDAVRLRRSERVMPLGFTIRCDDFVIRYYEDHPQMPEEFRSSLTLLEQGREILRKDVVVNDPLRYKGISIYQSGYGRLPDAEPAADALPEAVTLQITSRASGMMYQAEARVGQTIELPEGQGQLHLKEFTPSAFFGGQSIGAAIIATLTGSGAEAVELTLPLRFPNFDRMRRGRLVIAVGDVRGEAFQAAREAAVRYYTGLQVNKDPGVWLVYLGFMMMVAGCYVTFFTSHQRVCVSLAPEGEGCRVTVAGFANKNRLGMQMRMEKLARRLEKLGGEKGQ